MAIFNSYIMFLRENQNIIQSFLVNGIRLNPHETYVGQTETRCLRWLYPLDQWFSTSFPIMAWWLFQVV